MSKVLQCLLFQGYKFQVLVSIICRWGRMHLLIPSFGFLHDTCKLSLMGWNNLVWLYSITALGIGSRYWLPIEPLFGRRIGMSLTVWFSTSHRLVLCVILGNRLHASIWTVLSTLFRDLRKQITRFHFNCSVIHIISI
jgi:hypothetical protein